MNARRLLTLAAALLVVTLFALPEADARGRWRRARWSSPRTVPVQPARSGWQRSRRVTTGPVTYSGVFRGEQEQQRRREAWYEEAYNGWRPDYFW